MQDFPANSAKARARPEGPPKLAEEPEKIERVVSVPAEQRKRGLGRKFKETFIGGSGRMAMEYVVTDIVVPELRDLMFSALQGGLDRLIYGESRIRRGYGGGSRSPSSSSSYEGVGHVNYQGIISNKPSGGRPLSRQSRERHDFGDIILQSREDANDVLDRMFDVLSRYGSVPVSTLYALTGIQSSHTDEKWGWTSLTGARAAKQRNGGFLLDLPEPVYLDR
jgi:hypothetical protein